MNRLLHPIPGLSWSELRASAVECAAHGWPVVPGTYRLDERGPWLGCEAETLAPLPRWLGARISAAAAEDLWTRRPYSVLLELRPGWATIPIPPRRAREAARVLLSAGVPAPIVVSGCSAHILVAAEGPVPVTGMRPWIALPPGETCGQPSRWLLDPAGCRWRPPRASVVLTALSGPAREGDEPCARLSA